MLIVNPRNMIRKHHEWESEGCPRIPFPTAYIARCLATLYFALFFSAFLMYHILIFAAVSAVVFFLFSYYLFIRLWKLLGLSSWRFHAFFLAAGTGVCWFAVWLRTVILDYLMLKGW